MNKWMDGWMDGWMDKQTNNIKGREMHASEAWLYREHDPQQSPDSFQARRTPAKPSCGHISLDDSL
eukprot:scaffold288222_cov22-Prasinocladus_malaysianus.AAC.1